MKRLTYPPDQRGSWLARRLFGATASVLAAIGTVSTQAGSLSYDFSTDPSQGPNPILVGGNNADFYVAGPDGNPGGFLALTYPIGSTKTTIVFPDTDPGKVVTGFEFSCDLRVGNPQTSRAADGFSISFARNGDPILDGIAADPNIDAFAGDCCAETGTKTGIVVSFDTWAGNTYPNDPKDKNDIEGFLIRVDDVTVKKVSLPTRNGAADDITSLQTGPRDGNYWDVLNGDPKDPAARAGLAWKPFSVKLTTDGKLSVSYKGHVYLDNFQTAYFPTAGQLVFAGRTGGSNENTDIDNVKLTTIAASCAGIPVVPPNVRVTEAGSRRAVVAWDKSTIPADPTSPVGYTLEINGVTLNSSFAGNSYELKDLKPGTANTFKVSAKNVCGDSSAAATLTFNTVPEVDSPGILNAQVYRFATDGTPFGGGGQGDLDTVLADPKYPNSPDSVYYVNGFQFGEPNFGNTYGESFMARIAGVFTAPKSGSFRFFVRSDDSSRLYLKPGTTLPDVTKDTAIAQKNGCCNGFDEPGTDANDDGTFPTSEPVSLTAGSSYSLLFLVKEGGGGDWGQVGWREEGTKQVNVLLGSIVSGGKGDAVGAVANITNQPVSVTVPAYLPAKFSVGAETFSPYGVEAYYQWYKNGTAIIGANGATYTIPVVDPADNNAKIKAVVGVVGKAVTSAEATLTVTADQPPAIASVTGSDSFTTATVTFNQPVQAASAATAANYTFDKGLTVTAATVVDAFNVRLTTSSQTAGAVYKLTVNNVLNLAGKPAVGAKGDLAAWVLTAGAVRLDQYTGLNGNTLADMDAALADPKFPNSPDNVLFLSNGLTYGEPNFGDTLGDNYVATLRGILTPTDTASYYFFVRSDDASRLFINKSGPSLPDPKTATAVATEAGCCRDFQEPGAGVNGDGTFPTSDPISLTAGQSYGIVYVVKEGGGGDWGQVAWRKSTDSTAAATLNPIKSNIFWYAAPPAPSATIAISTSPTGVVSINYTGVLESSPSLSSPTWTAVTGATSPYTVTTTGAGLFYRSRN